MPMVADRIVSSLHEFFKDDVQLVRCLDCWSEQYKKIVGYRNTLE